jgi:ADP-ribose pyrophosphatase YjhB (NUDIX family)
MHASSPNASTAFRNYAESYPAHVLLAEAFIQFARLGLAAFERSHPSGHFTGSAWLVSADGERVLLTHHRKLGRWLQLGGHADGDVDLARVALREAGEESGLSDLVVEQPIFDLDRHRIPARGEEPEHWHYDVRHVVRAIGSEVFAASEESLALAWKSIRNIAVDVSADASLQRMARKWLERNQPDSSRHSWS